MTLPRRDLLKLAGLGLGSIVLPSWKSAESILSDGRQDDQPIRLRSNENAYGPSPKAKAAIAAQVAGLNRYGWAETGDLIDAIAVHHRVEAKNILVGAGSTEMLDIIGRYAAQEPGELLLPGPVFDYWTVTTIKLGLKNVYVPVDEEKMTDLQAMRSAISERTRLVYICNPNNPTGTICRRQDLALFIREAAQKAVVLVDEAYIDYSNEESVISLIQEVPNLVVVRTFSKIHGLAGARIGYAIGNPQVIENIQSLQSAPNASVSGASAAGAMASLKDSAFSQSCKMKNKEVMVFTVGQLNKLGLRVVSSHANFIYFSLDNYKGDYFERLKAANIEGTKIYEENGKWTRITIGTMEEMRAFMKAIG